MCNDNEGPITITRQACGLHQKLFFYSIQCNKNSLPESSSNHNTYGQPKYSSPSKITHANKIFNEWNNDSKKSIHSNRIGTTYQTSYFANTRRQIFTGDYNYMYSKKYTNYDEICTKYSPKTLKNQEKRRAHIYRTQTTEGINDENDQQVTAGKAGYLLHKNSTISKKVSHLKYRKMSSKRLTRETPSPSDYTYNVPFFSINHARRNVMLSTLSDDFVKQIKTQMGSTSSQSTIPITPTPPQPIIKHIPIPNWKALPDNHNLPNHLIPFIPSSPIFSGSGKTYYAPGSREWERKIRQIYKKHKEELKREQAKARKILQVDHVRLAKIEEATYYGTTIENIDAKFDKIDSLDYYTERFDYHAKQLQFLLNHMNPSDKQDLGKLKMRNNQIANLKIKLPKKRVPKKKNSSDIIKPWEPEYRLNKRPTITTQESSLNKKLRPTSPCPEDHEKVGTSNHP
jgi:hypothetical protein